MVIGAGISLNKYKPFILVPAKEAAVGTAPWGTGRLLPWQQHLRHKSGKAKVCSSPLFEMSDVCRKVSAM